MQVIGEWVEPQSRVLDLGCGRGELMAYLVQAKQVSATGVDLDFARETRSKSISMSEPNARPPCLVLGQEALISYAAIPSVSLRRVTTAR